MSGEEEARAAAYREQAVRREAFEAQLDARMAGDTAVRAELSADWQPIVDWNEQLRSAPDAEPQRRIWP